jgi:hypothetical protein
MSSRKLRISVMKPVAKEIKIHMEVRENLYTKIYF